MASEKSVLPHLPGLLIMLSVGLAAVLIFSETVPYHMDEFLPYKPIACWQYRNMPADYCEKMYVQVFPLGRLPMKAFDYGGSLMSVIYYPLFLAWKSPLSARFLGVIFLLVQSVLIGRILNLRWEAIYPFLLACFAYSFQHMVDTGPIAFQATSIYAIYLLAGRFFRTKRFGYAISAAVLAFLGVWAKLTYFWMLPGVVVIFLSRSYEVNGRIPADRGSLAKLLASAAIAALLSGLLMFSTTSDGKTYLGEMSNQNLTDMHLPHLYDAGLIPRPLLWALVNPFESSQRIYGIPVPPPISYFYDAFILLSFAALWLALWNSGRERAVISSIAMFFAAAATFLIIASTVHAWAMHHVILIYPFLILSFIICFAEAWATGGRRGRILLGAWLLLFLAFNSYFFLAFDKNPIIPYESMSMNDVNGILADPRLSEDYVYVAYDYGIYSYQALYGDSDQVVVTVEGDSIPLLRNMSESTGRRLLFIYDKKGNGGRRNRLLMSFRLKSCDAIPPDSSWGIMLEGGGRGNICLSDNVEHPDLKAQHWTG